MSRLVQGVLQVVEGDERQPLKVYWQGSWMRVLTVLERWYDVGKWWEGEASKLFFRVQLEGNQVWELFLNQEQESWNLYKIYD